MRREVQIHLQASSMGLKPAELAVERCESFDQRLVTVARGLGEQDGLKRHQVLRKQVVVGEPAAQRVRGQIAGGKCVQKRGTRCLVPQPPSSTNECVNGH